jgi:hypothetical protein
MSGRFRKMAEKDGSMEKLRERIKKELLSIVPPY